MHGRETGSPAQMKEIINSFNSLKGNDANRGREWQEKKRKFDTRNLSWK
jgi:hypothetical protein